MVDVFLAITGKGNSLEEARTQVYQTAAQVILGRIVL